MELIIKEEKDENGKTIYWVCNGEERLEWFSYIGDADAYKRELEARDEEPPSFSPMP